MTLDQARQLVRSWLRSTKRRVRALEPSEIAKHDSRDIAFGWRFPVQIGESDYQVRVLLSHSFPYSQAIIALGPPDDFFLKWPHVESDGKICLPSFSIDCNDPILNVRTALALASEFIEENIAGVDADEFEREFVSYWGQSLEGSHKIISIFDPGGESRPLYIRPLGNSFVASDSEQELDRWCERQNIRVQGKAYAGLFVPLKTPPVPPYQEKARELVDYVRQAADGGEEALRNPRVRNDQLFMVLTASVGGKQGLVGARIFSKRSINGFRPGHLSFEALRLFGQVDRYLVRRADANWIHGRDTNPHIKSLVDACVTIIGCGSLGSHVAIRLAQAGVGKFRLIDPERLEPQNVGRHALGMNWNGQSKALALEAELQRRFPHIKLAKGYLERWETSPHQEVAWSSDVLISTTGEAASELLLNQQHLSRGEAPWVVYGWMEDRAVAAHALAISGDDHCLQCVLSPSGQMKLSESEWDIETLEVEPACGTFFQPYGPIELGGAELLVADTVLDVLTKKITGDTHRVRAASTGRIDAAGGSWTAAHHEFRPANYDGALEFERPIPNASECTSGLHSI